MNEKLNLLLKATNELKLSPEESEVLKKELAMELILSPFIIYEKLYDDGSTDILGPDEGAILFSRDDLAQSYYNENVNPNDGYRRRIINLEFFMGLSENGRNLFLEINPGTGINYHMGIEDFIYLDEIYNTPGFKDYWRSGSTAYLKDAVKTVKNENFINYYEKCLKSLDEKVIYKLEDVKSSEFVRDMILEVLYKTTWNYEKYSQVFDDQLLDEVAKLKIFVPVYSDDVTIADEYNGVIDVTEHEEGFSIGHVDIYDDKFMLGYTDIDRLTELDDLFLPQADAKNKNYYVQLKPFTFVIEFILSKDIKGLVLNLGSDDYFLIEKETILDNIEKLVLADDLKLVDCCDLALNHLYL